MKATLLWISLVCLFCTVEKVLGEDGGVCRRKSKHIWICFHTSIAVADVCGLSCYSFPSLLFSRVYQHQAPLLSATHERDLKGSKKVSTYTRPFFVCYTIHVFVVYLFLLPLIFHLRTEKKDCLT
jgi:hypothetical protein